MILASGGDLASTGISYGNSTVRIFGIYPEISGTYPKQVPETIVLKTVVEQLYRYLYLYCKDVLEYSNPENPSPMY